EREDEQHLGDRAPDLADAAPAPRPDRRADVVDRGHARPLELHLQVEVEIRRVHADEKRGRLVEEMRGEAAPYPADLPVVTDDLDVAADRELVEGIEHFHAGGAHFPPADADEAHARS